MGSTEKVVRVERDGDRVNVVTRDDAGKYRRYFNVRLEGAGSPGDPETWLTLASGTYPGESFLAELSGPDFGGDEDPEG